MTNSEARKRAQEAAEAAENSISRPASPQPANSTSDALAGSQGVEAIRARDVEMLLADARAHSMPGRTHPWCPSCVDGIEALAAALTAARAEVAEVSTRLSGLLCELTGGLMSKTGYPVPVMVAAIESEFEKCAAEEMSELAAEHESLLAVVASVRELADGDLLVSPSELRAALTPTTTETGDES